MEVESIRSFEHLKSIRPDWLDLCGRSESTPFQRPEWLLCWWPIFGSGELFSFGLWDNNRLVGLAPLFLHNWNNRRQVTFIGNGVSDYLGFLVDANCSAEGVRAIIGALLEKRDLWDLCDLQDLTRPSEFPDGLKLYHAVRPQYICSRIPLPASCNEFRDSLSNGMRRNLRRYREKLDRLGRVTFETTLDGREIDSLIDLHRSRWRAREGDGMIQNASTEKFHRHAATSLAGAGMVRLHTIRVDNRIIAAVYVLRQGPVVYSYLCGFDPEFERFSVGTLSVNYAIEQSILEGARVYDFLRGEETYKSSWGARLEQTYRLLLWHEKPPADLLEAA